MIEEKRFQVFIDSVNRYFNDVNNVDVEVGTPYLVENNAPTTQDYTGIIGISGPYRGSVYFTAPQVLLKNLLMSLQEPDSSEENLLDLIGEIANTIAGNARSEYGAEFMISVPLVVKGAPDKIHLPKTSRSFVIPIGWKRYTAAIVISLERQD